MTDGEFFIHMETTTLTEKKQTQKGLEIEMHRLAGYINEARVGMAISEESVTKQTDDIVELVKLHTRMTTRVEYATYLLRKEAKELMSRGQ